MVDAAAVGDRPLLQGPQAGGRLARVEQPRGAAGGARSPGRRWRSAWRRRTAGRGSSARSARRSGARPRRRSTRSTGAGASRHSALGAEPLDRARRGRGGGTPPRRRASPEITPGAFCVIVATPRARGVDGRRDGHVPVADVLGERTVDQLVRRIGHGDKNSGRIRLRGRDGGRSAKFNGVACRRGASGGPPRTSTAGTEGSGPGWRRHWHADPDSRGQRAHRSRAARGERGVSSRASGAMCTLNTTSMFNVRMARHSRPLPLSARR